MKRALSLLLALGMALSLSGCGGQYEQYCLVPNQFLLGESLSEDGQVQKPQSRYNDTVQLSAEDIQKMNGGKAHMVFDSQGYLTFLYGRFSQQKVEDYEDAVLCVNGVAALIGLSAGSEFFAVYYGKDDDGYTYYTFQQRYGESTVQYATLRIIVDPEGYTAGLSSSFTPNLGIADTLDAISAQQAEQVVRETFPELELSYYPEHTSRVAVTIDSISYHAYAVYTNNPNQNAGDFDMLYYEHFVSIGGEYLYNLPVASLSTDDLDAFKAEEYFAGLEPRSLTATVTLYDGSTQELTLPIAYNPKTGLYYLADIDRRIMTAEFYSVIYKGVMDFITSEDGRSWDNGDLLAYDRYIKAYDFYAALGADSVDGSGIPILICTGYCDQAGAPIDNAGYCGINRGWACFGVSDVNTYSQAMDVVAHEFTHGITGSSVNGVYYANETGAISEAYSDIMGNLCEMLTGSTQDTAWLLGENCGHVFRSMSSPMEYGQPVEKGGRYYYPLAAEPMNDPDYGGVHANSSLLGQMAYKLYEAGMGLREQQSLWFTSIELITPLSGYREVHGALLMSVDINGLDAKYKQVITDAFQAAGLLD